MPTKGVAIVMHFYAGNASGPVTGDQANLTMSVVKDGVMSSLSTTTVTQANATYCPGIYSVNLDNDENDADTVTLTGYSSTVGCVVTPTTWTNVPPLTAAAAADAVWDEATSGHTTSGTFGEQCKTDIDAILTDTGTTIPALLAAGVPVSALGAGSISTATFAAGAIDAAAIGSGAIDADAIAADAIKASKIADDAIGADQLADNSITSAKIATDAIDADAIAADAITSVEIADGSLTAAKFAADCITSAKIADDAIGADQIADDSITSAKIKDGAITTAKIVADVSANVKQINGSTTGVSGLQKATSTVVEAQVHTGSSSTSIVSDTAGLSSTDSAYVRRNLTFTSGALQNETSVISAYVGSSKTLTVSVAFSGVPAEDDLFIIS